MYNIYISTVCVSVLCAFMSQSEVTSETWHLRNVLKFIAINLGHSNESISLRWSTCQTTSIIIMRWKFGKFSKFWLLAHFWELCSYINLCCFGLLKTDSFEETDTILEWAQREHEFMTFFSLSKFDLILKRKTVDEEVRKWFIIFHVCFHSHFQWKWHIE